MSTFDIAIIGAGPGGSAAAITAVRGGARVLLFERSSFPRHKVCGEFVSAESLGLLAKLLGSASAQIVDSALRVSSARIFLDDQVVEASIDPPAASIARFDLDAAMWSAAAASGVKTQEQTLVIHVERDTAFRIQTSARHFSASALIDASGRWSNLSHARPAPNPKWIGLKAHFREPAPSPTVDLYFIDGGYCGVQPVNLVRDPARGQRINVCAMVRSDVAKALDQLFMLHPALLRRSKTWQPLTEVVATSALVFRDPSPTRDKKFAVGDAAGFVDPFVGDGISLALRSGSLAAECYLEALKEGQGLDTVLDTYRHRYNHELSPIFRASSTVRKMLALPGAIRRPALALFNTSPRLKKYLMRRTRQAR